METLYELIMKIIKFPEIYIGKPSLERLYAFIGGYLYQNGEKNDCCIEGFTEFVSKKYGIHTDHNWASIICFFSNNDEEAFQTFIRLFQEYTTE